MTLPRTLLLDTSILLHLVRDSRVGRSIESRFRVRTRVERPLISIITLGEMMAFVKRGNWGSWKRSILDELLQDAVIMGISDQVLEAYAEIDTYLVRTGNPIQQNDIWIAATAIASGAHLLTTDKDFNPLYPTYLDRTWIDPQRPDA